MNRSQLLNAFAEANELTRKEADALVTSLLEIITNSVASGDDVAISGFAKFKRIDRPARMARNPATGEQVRVKAKRVARITPLKNFKDAVLSGKASKPAAKKAGEEGSGPQARGQEGAGQEEGGREEDRQARTGSQARQASLTVPSTAAAIERLNLVSPGAEPGLTRVYAPLRLSVVHPFGRAAASTAAVDAAVPNRVGHDRGEGSVARASRHARRRSVGASAQRSSRRRTCPRRSTPPASHFATSWSPASSRGAGSTPYAGITRPRPRSPVPCSTRSSGPRGARSRRYLGGTATHVDAGVAVGMQPDRDMLLEVISGYAAEGYRSMKLKIARGHDVDLVAAVRSEVGVRA